VNRQAVAREQCGLEVVCAWRQEWFRPAIAVARGKIRRCAPGGTQHPPGGLGAGSAWRYVSPARRFILLQL